MTTKHLVDTELLGVLDVLPELVFTEESLPLVRTAAAEMFAQQRALLPVYENIEVTERFVPGPEGAPDVRVLVYIPKDRPHPLPALLWIHGGGYIIGSADQDDAQVKGIVNDVGCAAVSVDYRLAPETAHPGPVEDCYAALKWLHGNADELDVNPDRIAIGGASAGGGLAAALGLLTRDRGEIPLALQLLIYPMLDDRTVTAEDPHPYVGEFVWNPAANYFGWRALLGQEPGSEGVSPYAAAARAENLAGLPPTFINVGALDLFLEEDLEYARRLLREGIATEVHVYPSAFHGFNMAMGATLANMFNRDCNDALRRALFR